MASIGLIDNGTRADRPGLYRVIFSNAEDNSVVSLDAYRASKVAFAPVMNRLAA
jgi:hypothetical protein